MREFLDRAIVTAALAEAERPGDERRIGRLAQNLSPCTGWRDEALLEVTRAMKQPARSPLWRERSDVVAVD